MKIAVCPGSFDPITVGHLDLVERGAALFDQVILCVMVNGEKHPMFTPEERLEMARAALSHIPNASAEAWDGLLADFARSIAGFCRNWIPCCCPRGRSTSTSVPPWCGI